MVLQKLFGHQTSISTFSFLCILLCISLSLTTAHIQPDTFVGRKGGTFQCGKDGFFRDPFNCTIFYRCADITGDAMRYQMFRFDCPPGTAYDEDVDSCNHPGGVPGCNLRSGIKLRGGPYGVAVPGSRPAPILKVGGSDQVAAVILSPEVANERCQNSGLFRSPEDCRRFYICVDVFGNRTMFQMCEYPCPDGTVFSSVSQLCMDPEKAEPCEIVTTQPPPTSPGSVITLPTTVRPQPPTTEGDLGSSSTTQRPSIPDGGFRCTKNGYFRHPLDCSRYFQCSNITEDGHVYERYEFVCGGGTVFDEAISVCNHPANVPGCENAGSTSVLPPTPDPSSTLPSTIPTSTSRPTPTPGGPFVPLPPGGSGNLPCNQEGFHRHPQNCSIFIRCVNASSDARPNHFIKHEFACAHGTVFDPSLNVCNYPEAVPGCGGSSVTSPVGSTHPPTHPTHPPTLPTVPTQPPTLPTAPTQPPTLPTAPTHPPTLPTVPTHPPTLPTVPTQPPTLPTVPTHPPTHPPTLPTVPTHPPTLPTVPTQPPHPSPVPPVTSGLEVSSVTPPGGEVTLSPPTVGPDGDSPPCTEPGYFRHPHNCSRFFRCVNTTSIGHFIKHEFSCGSGSVFDESINVCNHPDAVPGCGGGSVSPQPTHPPHPQTLPTESPQPQTSPTHPPQTLPTEPTHPQTLPTEPPHPQTLPTEPPHPQTLPTEPPHPQTLPTEPPHPQTLPTEPPHPQTLPTEPPHPQTLPTEPPHPQTLPTQPPHPQTLPTQPPHPQTLPTEPTHPQTLPTEPPHPQTLPTEPLLPQTLPTESPHPQTLPPQPTTVLPGPPCYRVGYFRHPTDCTRFYRCTNLTEDNTVFQKTEFLCGEGSVFDESTSVCNHPDNVPGCEHVRPTTVVPPLVTGGGSESSSPIPGGSSTSAPVSPDGGSTIPSIVPPVPTEALTSRPVTLPPVPVTTVSPGSSSPLPPWITTLPPASSSELPTVPTASPGGDGSSTLPAVTTVSPGGEGSPSPLPPVTTPGSHGSSPWPVPTPQPPITGPHCVEDGFIRHPTNCSIFYRCVNASADGSVFVRHEFSCGQGTVFDLSLNVCNYQHAVPECGGQGTTHPPIGGSSPLPPVTQSPGQGTTHPPIGGSSPVPPVTQSPTPITPSVSMAPPGSSSTLPPQPTLPGGGSSSSTPDGTTNYPPTPSPHPSTASPPLTIVPGGVSTVTPSPGGAITIIPLPDGSGSDIKCVKDGFFRDPQNCGHFYRCIEVKDDKNVTQSINKIEFICGSGTVFDESILVCNHPSFVPGCEGYVQVTTPCSSTELSGSSSPLPSVSSTSTVPSVSSSTSSVPSVSSSTTSSSTSGEINPPPTAGELITTLVDKPVTTSSPSVSLITTLPPSSTLPPITLSPVSSSSSPPGSSTPSSGGGSSTLPPITLPPISSSSSPPGSSTPSSGGGSSSSPHPLPEKSSCQKEGLHKHPSDCSKFIRCVDLTGESKRFQEIIFDCPMGTLFDETISVCNHAHLVHCTAGPPVVSSSIPPPISTSPSTSSGSQSSTSSPVPTTPGGVDSSSTLSSAVQTVPTSPDIGGSSSIGGVTNPSTLSPVTIGSSTLEPAVTVPHPGQFVCVSPGKFTHDSDCTKFYLCQDLLGDGLHFHKCEVVCPSGTIFDPVGGICVLSAGPNLCSPAVIPPLAFYNTVPPHFKLLLDSRLHLNSK